ncbi:MAG: ATP/GTP-binding protein [Bryobacterales bacterium]|nr:ATP/GTP-binding protein [Acidobacteriota bacterium]MCB9384285.1 ATP/GTP-binding protein [Bryobacterales bacterium]
MDMDVKIVFLGPTGVGKTTAIRSIATKPTVSTEAPWTGADGDKTTTTVALDYGERPFEEGGKLRLYGVPGQARFRFLWESTCLGALGVILLADSRVLHEEEAAAELCSILAALPLEMPSVVGVTHCDLTDGFKPEGLLGAFARHGIRVPVTCVDARETEDVLALVDTLLTVRESITSDDVQPASFA